MKDSGKLMSMLAFIALIISALIWVVLFILGLFDQTANLGWLQFIANILLVLVVIWVAWQYAKGLGKVWKIIFIVIAVIAVLSALGVNLLPQLKK